MTVLMDEWNDGCKMRPEAATRSDSLYLSGQGVFFIFVKDQSDRSRGILKSDAYGNEVKGTSVSKV